MALSPKDPQEVITVTFDFSALAASVSSPTVTVSRVAGNADASPSSMLSGSPQVSGAQVLQKITGGINGTTYDLKCLATLPDGSIEALGDKLYVVTV